MSGKILFTHGASRSCKNSLKRVRAFHLDLEFESVGFKERAKPEEYPEKNLSEQGREPTTNSTHIWRRRRDLSPGHIGGRRVPSPLNHPHSSRVILRLP